MAILSKDMMFDVSPRFFKIVSSLMLATFFNVSFLNKILSIYPTYAAGLPFVTVVTLIHGIVIYQLISFFSFNTLIKPVTLFLFFVSTLVTYQTLQFGTVLDRTMILNILGTDAHEASDLMSWQGLLFVGAILLLAWVISARVKLLQLSLKQRIQSLVIDLCVSIVMVLVLALPFNKQMASFLREHKTVRFYAIPTFGIYSMATLALERSKAGNVTVVPIGQDGQISKSDIHRDLVIFVLGETARAKNFSLNGYVKETNPLLKLQDVTSLQNMYSCGTSTAVSVPCMFSIFGRDGFTHEKAESTYNLVDVLYQTDEIDVLWRDNNSDSKGVAVRVPYENFKTSSKNPVCDVECRDVGMLSGLQNYIDRSPKKDILIVLHQMGNHGPAYFKRYPKEFEKFKPACRSIELNTCSDEEIVNAYDNAILYTDFFLNEVIELLKRNEPKFETALFYVSDHGESLGENGIYLHGLPYSIAPEEQKHTAALVWMGPSMKAEHNIDILRANAQATLTHDHVFHTILGLFEIETSIYDQSKDMLKSR